MKYKNIVKAKFLSRPNRFIAFVDIEGKSEKVHVKNTGRCKELLIENSPVYLNKSDNENRKTKYDLVAVEKQGLGIVNIDSMAPNTVTLEWLKQSPTPFGNITKIKPEYTFGNSRIDFYIECENKKVLMEVKGCTLEKGGIGYFPDAPTIRGVKHIEELASALDKGYETYLAFVIAMPNVREVRPNIDTHKEFGTALKKAKQKGVKVIFLMCDVSHDTLKIIDYKID